MVNEGFRYGETKTGWYRESQLSPLIRGGSFLFFRAAILKGGGSVETDLGDLNLKASVDRQEATGIVEPAPDMFDAHSGGDNERNEHD